VKNRYFRLVLECILHQFHNRCNMCWCNMLKTYYISYGTTYLIPLTKKSIFKSDFYVLLHCWRIYYNGLQRLMMMLASTPTKADDGTTLLYYILGPGRSFARWRSNGVVVAHCRSDSQVVFFDASSDDSWSSDDVWGGKAHELKVATTLTMKLALLR